MVGTTVRGLSALTVVAAFSALAFAQAPATAPGSTETSTVRAKTLLGSVVHIRGGHRVGTVEDIVLSNEGVVDYLIVAREGKLVTVPWEATKFNYGKRIATVDVTQEQYNRIPTYTTERYPSYYTPTYRTQIYKYYNLTPAQERRLERRRERNP